MASIDSKLLRGVVNHVVLPPDLPGSADMALHAINQNLISRLHDATSQMKENTKGLFKKELDLLRESLNHCQIIHAAPHLDSAGLQASFRTLEEGQVLMIHVTKQNAGLLVRRGNGDLRGQVVFEAFELSPKSSSVLEAHGALQWDFPTSAAAIPAKVFADIEFRRSLAEFLEKASRESIAKFGATAQKANSTVGEPRDTSDPAMVTSLLVTLLEGIGHLVTCQPIRKRVRDEVHWKNGSEPWRRSPFWLLLRVGATRLLHETVGPTLSSLPYKGLMSVVLAHLLADSVATLHPEVSQLLLSKLCRRLAKLEKDKAQAIHDESAAHYTSLLTQLTPWFLKVTQAASDTLNSVWDNYKARVQRKVPHIQTRCSAKKNLELRLTNSLPYLTQTPYVPPVQSVNGKKYVMPPECVRFMAKHAQLAETESKINSWDFTIDNPAATWTESCVALSTQLGNYLSQSHGWYEIGTEDRSCMILKAMLLWTQLDRLMCQHVPHFHEFPPVFRPEALDCLRLSRRNDLDLLHQIQVHLRSRALPVQHVQSRAQSTILDKPGDSCFAERYFESLPPDSDLHQLHDEVERADEARQKERYEKWQTLDAEHERMTREITSSSCQHNWVETGGHLIPEHDEQTCRKCVLTRRAERIRIERFEKSLPRVPGVGKAVMFELRCPESFVAYQNATWDIITQLGTPHANPTKAKPLTTVNRYYHTRFPDVVAPNPPSFKKRLTLASRTKCFPDTHFRFANFPVAFEMLIVNNGSNFEYFDEDQELWAAEYLGQVTFHHHCAISLPRTSPFAKIVFPESVVIERSAVTGSISTWASTSNAKIAQYLKGDAVLSSNEIIASRPRCPKALGQQEYLAFQGLMRDHYLLWPNLLMELGSSNLNFSAEAVMILTQALRGRTGPPSEDGWHIPNVIFRDRSFTEKLMQQIERRLRTIQSNCQENFCMEILLGLISKLQELGDNYVAMKSSRLMESAMQITAQWVRELRGELYKTNDQETSRRLSYLTLWAALLCRYAFFCLSGAKIPSRKATAKHTMVEQISTSETDIPGSWLVVYVEASISMQENLPPNPSTLSSLVRGILVRDIKSCIEIQGLLRRSLEKNSNCLILAGVRAGAMSAISLSSTNCSYRLEDCLDGTWANLELTSSTHADPLTVSFHITAGVFLIGGYSVDRELPSLIRDSKELQRLFPGQRIVIYPSTLPGMTYKVGFNLENHEVHLGFRNGSQLVVRAWTNGSLLEYIPSHVFEENSTYDLPAPLIEDCVHWLDLRTNVIEARKWPRIWESLPSNWRIDIAKRCARRRESTLVDPRSMLFDLIAGVFRGFEDPRQITVYQPRRYPLSVELRRFELRFFVNNDGLLESQQLNAEIDEDQDTGVWHGLSSKIVLRDTRNHDNRSIIVPLGPLQVAPRGIHVQIQNKPADAAYGRFFVDKVLGRLTCAAEPRLQYTKALLHACTSFCLPDGLTGRTGVEESCDILASGASQPYTTLNKSNTAILIEIANLAPVRQYYPTDLHVMESVAWKDDLPKCIQDDRLALLAASILEKSRLLAQFDGRNGPSLPADTDAVPDAAPSVRQSDQSLVQRCLNRKLLYLRPHTMRDLDPPFSDVLYELRGYNMYSTSQQHVFEAVRLIHQWTTCLPSPTHLQLVFQQWPFIGGYGDGVVKYEKVRLSDQLETDIASCWGSLVNLFRLSGPDSKYNLAFLLAALCFREEVNLRVIQTLVAFAIFDDLRKIDLPSWPSYNQFRPRFRPKIEYCERLLQPCEVPFSSELEGQRLTQRQRKELDTSRMQHKNRVQKELKSVSEFLCAQWPCSLPSLATFTSSVLDLESALDLVAKEWHEMFRNHELEEHLRQVQDVLDARRGPSPQRMSIIARDPKELSGRRGYPVIQMNLLDKEGPAIYSEPGDQKRTVVTVQSSGPGNLNELVAILGQIPTSKSVVRQGYLMGLRMSVSALEAKQSSPHASTKLCDVSQIASFTARAESSVRMASVNIMQALKQTEPGAEWMQRASLWPLTTQMSLLECLRSTSGLKMTSSMRDAITQYALLITRWQHCLRLTNALRCKRDRQVEEELSNVGHSNWDPTTYPDWLLLEIEANILIRPNQAVVASAIMSPDSGTNSVLQLNMGQGKTSTIIPMVALVLADGQSLCRVVVPKALLLQTAQLLQTRLGGLLGREMRHIPFSRRTPSDPDTIRSYVQLHGSILQTSGVMLSLPEHMMSFKLSGQQRLVDGRMDEATTMVKAQRFLDRTSRDIFDESDFTMAVRTQLIYPSGAQVTVDGGQHRWETIQAVLRLVESHLYGLEISYPSSIQVVRRVQGGFPFIYFLRNDVQAALVDRLASDICSGSTSVLNMARFAPSESHAISTFIKTGNPPAATAKCIEDILRSSPKDGYVIYLLRGLFVHRILLLTLSRRWNVQYGLHPSRDPVAVPFLAKGIPSNMAEWGHADVSLLFTCLSFYYQGLSIEQQRQSLEQILKSDDPAREYEQWTHGAIGLPDRLRDWTSLNISEGAQLAGIWQAVRHNVAAIDHFLNNFVFPKHAKQFEVKLQASGWDLPLAGQGSQLTTGFSGTNDNRLVLPLTIKQDDLPELAHTNAEVLTYLLHPRNRGYRLAGQREVREGHAIYSRLTESDLLRNLKHLRIRVLIDSGATILEMSNATLAKCWLDIDTEAPAAVYFDDDNRATVLTRSGRKTPLMASPYAEDLSGCLVYLDESHTRGTDMKFAADAHGAVTLSLGQTKDQTVQAVMRLRQLATTQRVTFFAPPEVHQSILDFRKKGDHGHLDSADVVCWLLEQTIQSLENLQPLFYAQGINFCRRSQALKTHSKYLSNAAQRTALLETLQDSEAQSLQSLYGPRKANNHRRRIDPMDFDEALAPTVRELETRRRAFQDTGTAVSASALQEVEQEREVAVEAETIREREKPVHFYAHSFAGLSIELRTFVSTGVMKEDDMVFHQAFAYLKCCGTSLRHPADLPATPRLLVSLEYRKTAWVPSGQTNDDLVRPVQWILWSRIAEKAIIVSPEEVEELIPLCRTERRGLVHLLAYAAPVTHKMLPFNDLDFYAIPALPEDWRAPTWIKVQLGIFAGRLYFPLEELPEIRYFLCLEDDGEELRAGEGSVFEATASSAEPDILNSDCVGEVNMDEAETTGQRRVGQVQSAKMLTFVHAWITTRGQGEDFTHTPMGYLCGRKPLTKDHPFFKSPDADAMPSVRAPGALAGDLSEHMFSTSDPTEEDGSSVDDEELDDRQKLTEEELMELAEDEEGEEDVEAIVGEQGGLQARES